MTYKVDEKLLEGISSSIAFVKSIYTAINDYIMSFDTQGTIMKAKKLIALYKEFGVDSDRVLIKIASTWEGIKAAEELERAVNKTLNAGLRTVDLMNKACTELGCREIGEELLKAI